MLLGQCRADKSGTSLKMCGNVHQNGKVHNAEHRCQYAISAQAHTRTRILSTVAMLI